MSEDSENDGRWHVTRNIPIALIISMLIFSITQTATAAWFLARQDGRLDVVEKAQAIMSPQGERLTRVEEKLENVKSGITEIKSLLTQDNRTNRTR